MKIPNAQLEPVNWDAMEGWSEDDHAAAFATFFKSCQAILRGTKAQREARPLYGALYEACAKAASAKPADANEARAFFEANFRPYRISPLGDPDGFVTGYYEPIVDGSRTRSGENKYPLYRKPPNLLPGGRMMVKGPEVSIQNRKGKKKRPKVVLVPFHERAAIDDGVLSGKDLEICWLKDPIEAFFIHIQGSVRVRLDDGQMMRLNYMAQNGHPYYPVGRTLIERKIVPREEMSMDRIRQWMEANPAEAVSLRRQNKSYVFFRETNLADDEEAIGAQGVSLTPWRSIAVDRNLHVYGTPFFISANLPIQSDQANTPFRRLMVAQDTGGAIVGPARADIYFGAGAEPGRISGRLRHPGRFVMLIPNALDPNWDKVPLPRPRPDMLVADAKPGKPADTVVASKAGTKLAHNADKTAQKTAAKKTTDKSQPQTASKGKSKRRR